MMNNLIKRCEEMNVKTDRIIEEIKLIEEENWLFFSDIMCECLKLYKDKRVKNTEGGKQLIKNIEEIICEFE